VTSTRGQPNIVFILADDLGWADLGCYGSTFHETPVLDGLAAEGARLTDAYAAAPVCSPTRASIMTGRYPATVGVTQYVGGHGVGKLLDTPSFNFLPTNEHTVARGLREAGYQTWHVGKWHLGPRRTWPDQHGFDINVAGCDWGHPKNGYFSPYGCPTLEDGPPGEYLTDRLTDEAIRLVENSGDRPFFLHLSHYAVHIPIQSPAELVAKYERKAAAMGLDAIDPFEDGDFAPVWHNRHARIRRRIVQSDPAYAAMVENLDTNIGRLLESLHRAGKADHTLVMFTSDNGGLSTAEGSPTCNAPLSEGKGWTQEGGIREPLIVRWSGVVAPGSVIHEPVTSPDFYPTLLAAAGGAPRTDRKLEGVDLTPLLIGEPFARGAIFWYYPHYSNQGGRPCAAVREGRWKLIHEFENGTLYLYDLSTDVGEQHDLADQNPDEAATLHGKLMNWIATTAISVPSSNPSPDPYPDLAGYFLGGDIAEPPND
jgi:arylsulfatase A-like enzyme